MDRKEKNTLPPDLYSRNTIISYLAEKLAPGGNLKVLDVGGYQGKLSLFMPKGTRYTILDKLPSPKGEKVEYIQGDAKKIPFSDNSFDIVVSSDMLEHVEKPFRAPIIREMIRVSKNHVILGVPCQSDLLEKAEKGVKDQFMRITGSEHPFLIEHSQYGLPQESKIEDILQKEGVNYALVKEGNLMNWYIQQLYSIVQHQENMEDHKYEFFRFFNDNLGELGNLRAPTYRTIFMIAKDGPLPQEEILQDLQQQNVWKPERFMETLQRAFGDLSLVIQEGEKSAGLKEKIVALQKEYEETSTQNEQNKKLLSASESQVKGQEERLNKARSTLKTYRETVLEVRAFLQEKEKTIQYLRKILEEKDERMEQLEQEEAKVRKERDDLEKVGKKLKDLILKNEKKQLEQDTELKAARQQIHELSVDLDSHKKSLQAVMNSRAWKMIMVYSKVKTALWTKPKTLVKKAFDILMHLGPGELSKRILRKIKRKPAPVDGKPYEAYVEKTKVTKKDKKNAEKEMAGFEYQPVVSIIMPSYNIDEKWLRKAIHSVQKQWYKRWELCICDDASTQKHIKPILDEYAKQDLRIKVTYREKNGGIVKASNDALKLANGAYVGFLDNDDELTPNALYEVVKALQEKKYDLIYSDEDKMDMEGKRCQPFFKPDWSPDLLLSCNYITHFAVYRRKIVNELDGLREGLDGSQDYDLVLRFTEKTKKIHHIPKILYHWRMIPGSAAASTDAKSYAYTSGKKALSDAAKRRGITASVTDGVWLGSYRMKRAIEGSPLVSIIIPFKDKIEVLKPCLESIITKSTWNHYEILLVNNRSELLETEEYLETLKDEPRIEVLNYDKPFNYSAINNFAAKKAKGEYLILLNNDTEVMNEDWIESMLEHAQRPEVGAVGAKLLFPNKQIQHAGVVVGIAGLANHVFSQSSVLDHGYCGLKSVVRNYSAVTAACIMVRKNVYGEIGGLDAENLAVSFNDVDFCLRLREKGYLIVYTPYTELIHYESLTRGYDVAMNEIEYMQRKHKGIIARDPYYNENLTRERLDFSLRVQDTVQS